MVTEVGLPEKLPPLVEPLLLLVEPLLLVESDPLSLQLNSFVAVQVFFVLLAGLLLFLDVDGCNEPLSSPYSDCKSSVKYSRNAKKAPKDSFKPIRVCHCDLNIECTKGILINMPPPQRELWKQQKLQFTVVNCCKTETQLNSNREELITLLKILSNL